MSLSEATIAPWARPRPDGPRPYRFDVDQFESMRDHGLFVGRRVELLDGEMIEQFDGLPGGNPDLREPESFRMTVAQYEVIAATGMFDGQRVELIDGEVIQMPPMSEEHAMSIALIDRLFQRIFDSQAFVRAQMPFSVPNGSLPEPDLALIEGSIDDADRTRPSRALLLVEVCLSTALEDRGRKPYLYAAAGVPEYWLVDLQMRRLEIFRKPIADQTELFGHRYGSVTVHDEHDTVAPLAKPDAAFKVAQLMLKK